MPISPKPISTVSQMLGQQRRHDALGVVELDELLFPILDVEADHQIGVLERLLVHRQAQRMLVGEVERVVDVPHRGAGRLGELDDALEAAGPPPGIFREQHRVLGLEQLVGDGRDRPGVRHHRRRRRDRVRGRQPTRGWSAAFPAAPRRSTCRSGLAARWS